VWEFATGGSVWSSPAVAADGTVYSGEENHRFTSPDRVLMTGYLDTASASTSTLTVKSRSRPLVGEHSKSWSTRNPR
jgi:outer membrane protein assembly factor BamB